MKSKTWEITRNKNMIKLELKTEEIHDNNCICEECCTHDDTECGHCIDCGAELELDYNSEPEINPDR